MGRTDDGDKVVAHEFNHTIPGQVRVRLIQCERLSRWHLQCRSPEARRKLLRMAVSSSQVETASTLCLRTAGGLQPQWCHHNLHPCAALQDTRPCGLQAGLGGTVCDIFRCVLHMGSLGGCLVCVSSIRHRHQACMFSVGAFTVACKLFSTVSISTHRVQDPTEPPLSFCPVMMQVTHTRCSH